MCFLFSFNFITRMISFGIPGKIFFSRITTKKACDEIKIGNRKLNESHFEMPREQLCRDKKQCRKALGSRRVILRPQSFINHSKWLRKYKINLASNVIKKSQSIKPISRICLSWPSNNNKFLGLVKSLPHQSLTIRKSKRWEDSSLFSLVFSKKRKFVIKFSVKINSLI